MDFSFALTPDLAAVFATLFVLELVLGIDNVIFISILAAKLPVSQQAKARNLGLTLAMVMRVGLVFLAGWIITLKEDVVTWFGMGFSVKDFILIAGGGFLVYKAVMEVHHRLEGVEEPAYAGAVDAAGGDAGTAQHQVSTAQAAGTLTFRSVLLQILALDIVFSLDSVITAVGMTENIVVIVSAVVISFGIMLFAARFIFAFVNKHPTVKMLALSFLLLIGVFLIAEGFGYSVDKAFIYGPMAFAILVESLNLMAASRKAKREELARRTVHLRPGYPRISESDTETVASALTADRAAGSVTISRRPVVVDEPGAPVPRD